MLKTFIFTAVSLALIFWGLIYFLVPPSPTKIDEIKPAIAKTELAQPVVYDCPETSKDCGVE